MALQQVQTPLKGGENTELSTGVVNIVGATPHPRHLPTPNILLRSQLAANTPFRTPQVGGKRSSRYCSFLWEHNFNLVGLLFFSGVNIFALTVYS